MLTYAYWGSGSTQSPWLLIIVYNIKNTGEKKQPSHLFTKMVTFGIKLFVLSYYYLTVKIRKK